ncbi:hypothetical protein [Dasychira pudibunda nucleopolyhedrovirus]|nr:hypothetical protein [Dasychira pudibunda nucleopolyhedrovirus]
MFVPDCKPHYWRAALRVANPQMPVVVQIKHNNCFIFIFLQINN